MKGFPINHLAVAFVLLFIGLSALIGANLFIDYLALDMANLPPARVAATKTTVLPELLLKDRPLSDYDAFRARPLFNKGRKPGEKPPPEGVAAEPPPIQPLNDLILAGVILTDTKATAFLGPKQPTGFLRLSVGDDVRGWKVKAIDADRIVFVQGDLTHEIRFAVRAANASIGPNGSYSPPQFSPGGAGRPAVYIPR